jgi:hypothetical protein
MIDSPKYAHTLRAIGQDLEALNLKYFDIKSEGRDYLVRAATSPEPLELRYTPEDIGRLERQGRAKRSDPSGTPDLMTLSQALRAIGEYVDRKDCHLVRISRQVPSGTVPLLSIEYQTGMRDRRKEEIRASGLYDLSVRMFKQRAG